MLLVPLGNPAATKCHRCTDAGRCRGADIASATASSRTSNWAGLSIASSSWQMPNVLQPQAGSVRLQELRSTYEALQQSRVALEERDFLIATHERSEAALAGHATGLTSGLQSAAANIEALFTRCAHPCHDSLR